MLYCISYAPFTFYYIGMSILCASLCQAILFATLYGIDWTDAQNNFVSNLLSIATNNAPLTMTILCIQSYYSSLYNILKYFDASRQEIL